MVFLRQLDSGLLLVTGPLKFNGVPLRRVNQAYVIATSTKVDIGSVNVPYKLDDDYFKRERSSANKKGTGNIFADSATSYSASDQRKADQVVVDEQLLGVIKNVPMLEGYLKSRFTLQKGQFPHEMKF